MDLLVVIGIVVLVFITVGYFRWALGSDDLKLRDWSDRPRERKHSYDEHDEGN